MSLSLTLTGGFEIESYDFYQGIFTLKWDELSGFPIGTILRIGSMHYTVYSKNQLRVDGPLPLRITCEATKEGDLDNE